MIKKSHFIPFLLFLISFGIYLKTLCPTIYTSDSGELIIAVYTLGIPHPPGYPLYCLLGKFFTLIFPSGNIAFRLNLMSALFASLTVSLLYLITLHITRYPLHLPRQQTGVTRINAALEYIPALAAALIFAFSLAFWSQAVTAEVYTLNAFFVVLTMLLLLIWSQKRKNKYLYWFAFFFGLSTTNHYAMLLLIPGYIFCILYSDRSILNRRSIPVISGLFLLGLTPFLYLPIRSLANPILDFGNPENLTNFLAHITRQQYGELGKTVQSLGPFLKQLFYFLRVLLQQIPGYILLLGLIGLPSLFKGNKRWFYTTLLLFLSVIFGTTYFLNYKTQAEVFYFGSKFYIPAYIVLAIWMGYGIEHLLLTLKRWRRTSVVWVGILILLLPLIPLKRNYFQNDKSRNYINYDYGLNLLETKKKNAIIITRGDNSIFPMLYLQQIEKRRQDIMFLHLPLLNQNWYLNRLKENYPDLKIDKAHPTLEKIIQDNLNEYPIYTVFKPRFRVEKGYFVFPEKLLYRIYKSEEEMLKIPDYEIIHARGIDDEKIFKDFREQSIIASYQGWYLERSNYFLKRDRLDEAIRECHRGLTIPMLRINYSKYMTKALYNNLAYCYLRKGQKDEALATIEKTKAIIIEPGGP